MTDLKNILDSLRLRSGQAGQAMMIAVMFFMAVSMTIIFGLAGPVLRQQATVSNLTLSRQSYFLAEAGIEDVVYRLKTGKNVSSTEVLSLGGSTTTVVTIDTSDGKQIVSTADVKSAVRKLKANIVLGFGTSFYFGIHVGEGGLDMKNNSMVIGNVYSNGEIEGEGSARIQGGAISARADGEIDDMQIDGDATAYLIEDSTIGGSTNSYRLDSSTVGGNVVSTVISNCTVGGNATYDSKSACSINGAQTSPNPNDYTPPPSLPFSISDEQISLWEAEAEAGGIISSQTYSSGSYFLGPKKINGNLIVRNTANLILTGPVWVTGTVDIINSAIVRLDQSYGNSSGVLLAGIKNSISTGEIEVENSAQVIGSGMPRSYLMLVSQRVGDGDAIDLENTSTVSIVYAPYGRVEIANNINSKSISAWKMDMENSATITYEIGLQNVLFSSGPSGGYEILSWKEIE